MQPRKPRRTETLSSDTPPTTISAIMADELAIGVINNKTTATRLVPIPGKKAGDFVSFGGLFGASPVMQVRNVGASDAFVNFGGRIPLLCNPSATDPFLRGRA